MNSTNLSFDKFGFSPQFLYHKHNLSWLLHIYNTKYIPGILDIYITMENILRGQTLVTPNEVNQYFVSTTLEFEFTF